MRLPDLMMICMQLCYQRSLYFTQQIAQFSSWLTAQEGLRNHLLAIVGHKARKRLFFSRCYGGLFATSLCVRPSPWPTLPMYLMATTGRTFLSNNYGSSNRS